MTLNMERIFRKAATKALVEWGREDGVEDLVQDMWIWYLESPGTQEKFANSDEFLVRKLASKAAFQILAGDALGDDKFQGRVLYSTDSIREALHGLSSNTYLKNILPIAMDRLQRRDDQLADRGKPRGYAEAIRVRYEDRVSSSDPAVRMHLSRAVRCLTDELNVMYLTSEVTGPGSRTGIFPDTRSPTGGHGDPTGDIAVLLIENPAMRDEYLEVTPIEELLEGRSAQHIRPVPEWDALLRDVSKPGDARVVPPPTPDVGRELERSGS